MGFFRLVSLAIDFNILDLMKIFIGISRNYIMNCMPWTDLSRIIGVKLRKMIIQVLLREVIYTAFYFTLIAIISCVDSLVERKN